jgi:RNA polymerase sigma factor (sigma-70 family)
MWGLKRVSEHKVIERIKQGDEDVLVHMYKEHYTMIRNFILKNNGDNGMAEDIMQECVIAVWQNVNKGEFVLQSKLSTYMMAIAKNLWFKQLKKRTRFTYVDESETKVVQIEHQQHVLDSEIIHKMVAQMDETCKKLLGYFYFDGYDNKLIAEKLGFANTDSVKSKKYQCFKRLQAAVLDKYDKEDLL